MYNIRKNEIDYSNIVIDGMHYVRHIKGRDNDDGKIIIIDNTNKPVNSAHRYLEYRIEYGDGFNTVKRIAYDICYFFDYLLFSNKSEESLSRRDLISFVSNYLLIIDPNYRPTDCIERSMFKKIPVLEERKKNNISVLYTDRTRGLQAKSIERIINNVKRYLIYLVAEERRQINLDSMFKKKIVNRYVNYQLLGHLGNRLEARYCASYILKVAKVPTSKTIINPIENSVIFELEEEEAFFESTKHNTKLNYNLLCTLLSETGMRISEALGLKLGNYEMTGKDINFSTLKGDLKLIDDKLNLWEIKIISRPDSPHDIKVKYGKSRTIQFVDSSHRIRNLLGQYLTFYRRYHMKKKKKQHDYLFINRNGDRLKYNSTRKTFNKILDKAEIENRPQLTLHSFRHTFASKWIKIAEQNGQDVELDRLAEHLGHSNSETTREVYIHFFKRDKINLLETLEKCKYQNERGE